MQSHDLSRLTVLIVDKHQPMRTMLRIILREFGVGRIFDASSPEAGFEEFNRVRPDLVLSDWGPEFDGIGLLKRIRTDIDSCYPQVPVIMLSAYGETNRVFEAADAGMNEYLVKPVSPQLLYMRILSAIGSLRPFIREKDYVGPSRRRHKQPTAGKNRRRVEVDVIDAVAGEIEPVAPADPAPAPAQAA